MACEPKMNRWSRLAGGGEEGRAGKGREGEGVKGGGHSLRTGWCLGHHKHRSSFRKLKNRLTALRSEEKHANQRETLLKHGTRTLCIGYSYVCTSSHALLRHTPQALTMYRRVATGTHGVTDARAKTPGRAVKHCRARATRDTLDCVEISVCYYGREEGSLMPIQIMHALLHGRRRSREKTPN